MTKFFCNGKQGFCDKKEDSYCTDCPHCNSTGGYYVEVKTKTNADRIRAMSDKELAKLLSTPCECSPDLRGEKQCGNERCVAYLLEWLQKGDGNG